MDHRTALASLADGIKELCDRIDKRQRFPFSTGDDILLRDLDTDAKAAGYEACPFVHRLFSGDHGVDFWYGVRHVPGEEPDPAGYPMTGQPEEFTRLEVCGCRPSPHKVFQELRPGEDGSLEPMDTLVPGPDFILHRSERDGLLEALRLWSRDVDRQIIAIDGAATPPVFPAPNSALSRKALACYEALKASWPNGLLGKQITAETHARGFRCGQQEFIRSTIPQLRAAGIDVEHKLGVGYFVRPVGLRA